MILKAHTRNTAVPTRTTTAVLTHDTHPNCSAESGGRSFMDSSKAAKESNKAEKESNQSAEERNKVAKESNKAAKESTQTARLRQGADLS